MVNTGVVKEVARCPNSSSDIVENVSIDCVLEQYHFGSNTLISSFYSSQKLLSHFLFIIPLHEHSQPIMLLSVAWQLRIPSSFLSSFLLSLYLLILISNSLLRLLTNSSYTLIQIVFHFFITCHLIISWLKLIPHLQQGCIPFFHRLLQLTNLLFQLLFLPLNSTHYTHLLFQRLLFSQKLGSTTLHSTPLSSPTRCSAIVSFNRIYVSSTGEWGDSSPCFTSVRHRWSLGWALPRYSTESGWISTRTRRTYI